eukprot:1642-Heterococcus_DN1.PRE.1
MLTLRHAVVAALVAVHASVKAATERNAAKSGGGSGGSSSGRSSSRHFVSPRDYLDLIASFVKVTSEKRGQLEEQQLHINVGLAKLAETQVRYTSPLKPIFSKHFGSSPNSTRCTIACSIQICMHTEVATLQRGLEAKEVQLHDKNALANAKLQQMLADQTVAERRKHEAEELSVVLEAQNARCATQRAAAQLQLSAAEPTLLAAQASVRSIKKAQLDEIRYSTFLHAETLPRLILQQAAQSLSLYLGLYVLSSCTAVSYAL